MLLDLGVSSLQLDEDDRGFSYSRPAPLDMRMDQSRGRTAAEVLATYPEAELRRILREYGEEKMAGKIAKIIVTDRETTPWETSDQLAAMLARVLPEGKKRSHPAKRTFQARGSRSMTNSACSAPPCRPRWRAPRRGSGRHRVLSVARGHDRQADLPSRHRQPGAAGPARRARAPAYRGRARSCAEPKSPTKRKPRPTLARRA